jgi:diguanylate cyclase (GGDEF)-like protein
MRKKFRWACGVGSFDRSRSFVRFAVGGGLIAAAFGPTFSVPVLTPTGVFSPDSMSNSVLHMLELVWALFLAWGAYRLGMHVAESRLMILARTDGLTGLANYRAAMDALRMEVARRMRRGYHFAVVFFDLDGLKQINDSLGHLAGNRAILRLSNAIAHNSRTVDTPARLGGDEFCVILPGADEQEAWRVADRITRSLAASGSAPVVRASAGVAVYPRDGVTAEALLGAADRLLYGAKARNAVPRAVIALPSGTPA